jgi:Cu/Ag efflux protein CusF
VTQVFSQHWQQVRLFVLLTIFGIGCISCSRARENQPPEKHYQVTGVVLGLDAKLQTANLQHGPIEGWMDAMTMDYPIRSKAEFEHLHVGDHITATVNVRGTDYDLSNIRKQNAVDH